MQAASVAVNQPNILPPMMMKGVTRAGIDTNSQRPSSIQVVRS
jgi:hypothetical protein